MSFDYLYFKLKNRFGIKSDKNETTLDKFKAQVHFIITLGYISGYEFTDKWRFNKRTLFTVCLISSAIWIWVYSIYVEYRNLPGVLILIAGLSLIVMVRLVIIRRNVINFN